eukprot:scaffold3475_cov91-Phaeocystis_antarctica.AAC.3
MEATPCEIMQSRSISPKRSPPSRARPSIGCRVSNATGPRAREWILSSTILHPPACVPVVHDLKAAFLIAKILEQLGNLVDGDRGKRSGIALVASERGDLGEQALNQVADGHARRDGVRVNDDVGRDALG